MSSTGASGDRHRMSWFEDAHPASQDGRAPVAAAPAEAPLHVHGGAGDEVGEIARMPRLHDDPVAIHAAAVRVTEGEHLESHPTMGPEATRPARQTTDQVDRVRGASSPFSIAWRSLVSMSSPSLAASSPCARSSTW